MAALLGKVIQATHPSGLLFHKTHAKCAALHGLSTAPAACSQAAHFTCSVQALEFATCFLDKEFCDLVKKDNDVSMLSYCSSSDFKRIDRGGVGWPPRLISRENTILIGLTADGCHMHTNAVRTGNSVFFLCC